MQAEVAILKRLPRRLDTLTYLIPQGLSLRRGDLVLVPFRTLKLHGIVTRVSSGSREKLKCIFSLVISQFVSDAYLQCMESLAFQLVQSLSTILYSSVLLPSNKPNVSTDGSTGAIVRRQISVRKREIDFVKEIAQAALYKKMLTVQITDLAQAAAIIQASSSSKGQRLILVPHHHDGNTLSHALGIPFFDATLKPTPKAQLATRWRTGAERELIATRLGSLLPAKDLVRAVIVRSGSPEHVQYDRNPRYDSREVLALRCGHVVSLEVLPRLNDLSKSEKTFWLPDELMTPVELIDLKQERGKELFLLTSSLLEAIGKALQNGKNVILSYNRKGVSRSQECRDCGWISTADQKEIAICPACKSTRLSHKGIGNQLVQKTLQKIFTGIPVVRSEAGLVLKQPQQPHIIVATQYYVQSVLDPFALESVGLIAELRADLGLLDTRYNALERLARTLWQLRGLAWRAKAPFLVQSFDAPLTRHMLDDCQGFLRDELETRKRFHYPPSANIYRVAGRLERPSRDELIALKQQPDSVIIERNPEV